MTKSSRHFKPFADGLGQGCPEACKLVKGTPSCRYMQLKTIPFSDKEWKYTQTGVTPLLHRTQLGLGLGLSSYYTAYN